MSTVYINPAVIWGRVLDRIVRTESGCWEFQGSVTSRGYGCIAAGRKGKSITTHRLAVLVRDGVLADDLTVDHLCHNASDCTKTGKECRHRRCVNPDHLDVCSGALNSRRARARHRFCARGHEIRSDVDAAAGVVTHLCDCGPIDSYEIPSWSAELGRAYARSA